MWAKTPGQMGLSRFCGVFSVQCCRCAVVRCDGEGIVIGSCAAHDGPSSFLGPETVRGAEAYFQLVNEEGGVNGRKLRLISYDDSYDPAKAQACWDKLMAQQVFALGFFVGTPTAAKYVPLADSNQIL
jgi:branched-chain amino acid transport system substrate-binding protein